MGSRGVWRLLGSGSWLGSPLCEYKPVTRPYPTIVNRFSLPPWAGHREARSVNGRPNSLTGFMKEEKTPKALKTLCS